MTGLVVFSLEAWDDVWRRNQYLVDGMLRRDPGLRVLFVEPAHDITHDAVHGRRPHLGAGLHRAEGYDGRLAVYAPTKWLPRRVGPLADTMLAAGLHRAWRRSHIAAATMWVNDPGWADVALRSGRPVIYDITDDWTVADRTAREHDRVVALDRMLVQRADAVIVCSAGLQASRGRLRSDVAVIPNAVDVDRYRRAVACPADAGGRYAVYVGTLHEDRLDVDLVVRTGRRLADDGCRLMLIGPNALSASNRERLERADGVDVRGAREHDDVPAYLQHAAALVVPHLVTAFTESLDPIKLYEYRAVGRPIVSTPVAGFRDLSDEPGVTIADRESFPDRVAETLAAPAEPLLVDVPDWSRRVDDVVEVLRRVQVPRGGGHAGSARTGTVS